MNTSLAVSDLERIGRELYQTIVDLYPICRSITGDGLRESLSYLQSIIPFEIREVPSGTKVLDWTVPNEWNIRDAYIRAPDGKKIADFRRSNLHVVNYSIPVDRRISLQDLEEHLHSLPENPEWIPYRTSYYNEAWGFCIAHSIRESLPDGEYDVRIDSSLEPGAMTYGEYYLPGEIEDEILISTHSCHPSLCNDNLSGMSLTAGLAKLLTETKRRYSFRFLFIPGTIGSITWLSLNPEVIPRIRHGLVVACVGDPGYSTYKKSRQGNAEIDRAVSHILEHSMEEYEILEFSPYGYDERQYSSPGYNLPVGCLSRTPHGRYPEYHSSADNLELVRPEFLANSFAKYVAVIDLLEHNRVYINTNPRGEPQLGRRGLYSTIGGRRDADTFEMAILWVLNQSDGTHSMLDIADRSGFGYELIKEAIRVLLDHDLLVERKS